MALGLPGPGLNSAGLAAHATPIAKTDLRPGDLRVTIGLPGFFLALSRHAERARPGILERVLRFAAPAGLVVAASAYTAYALARAQTDADAGDARTTATLVTTVLGLWVLALLARPLTLIRLALIAAMGGAFAAILVIAPLRDALALRPLPIEVWASATALALTAGLLIVLLRPLVERLSPPPPHEGRQQGLSAPDQPPDPSYGQRYG